jgi:hypothetical protein
LAPLTVLAGEALCLAQPVFTEKSAAAGVAAHHAPAGAFVTYFIDVAPFTAGGAAGDFNNDGWQDLFVVTSGGGDDRLFINNGDGTFSDLTASSGVGGLHMGTGAAVGDYDADGWLDIYETSFGPATGSPVPGRHRLLHNNGNDTFTDVASVAGVDFSSHSFADGFGAAFGDYDLDGDLDLYVTGWIYGSGGNRLFRNNGNGTFSDVTMAAGVYDYEVRGYAPRFADMDGDRYPELLVAADYGTSRYYVNNGDGTFTNRTMQSGTGLDGNGMGQTVADLNDDGLLDWYVTSIFTQNSPAPLEIPGTGNMLYMNVGNHTFVEVSEAAGVKDGGWGWGTAAVDFDHDGRLDLVETNGYATANGAGMFEWLNEQSYLFRSNGDGSFSEIAIASGFIHTLLGRGLVNFDYDNDGDQDVVIFANSGALKLYRNDTPHAGHNWLRVLVGSGIAPGIAPNGYGTRVVATISGMRQYRYIDSGCNYLSQSEPSAHFGLGTATSVDELRIEWTNGAVSVLENVAVNQTLTINSMPCSRPAAAGVPVPADAATGVSAGTAMTWSGTAGASYAVYFGTSTPPAFVGTVDSPGWSPPGPLLAGARYYWQVDTIGCSTTSGAIWSFTTDGAVGFDELSVRIISPTRAESFSTSEASIRLSGVANGSALVTGVTWSTDHGASGACTTEDHWSNWSTADIPLLAGECRITVMAANASGQSASAALVVSYTPASEVEPPVPVPVPPTVTILSPSPEGTYMTSNDSVVLAGTASDGVTRVSWANDRGGVGEAQGTTAWSAAITLESGPNLLTVTAYDDLGNVATAMLTVLMIEETFAEASSAPGEVPVIASGPESSDEAVAAEADPIDDAPPFRRVPPRRNACGSLGFASLAVLLLLAGRKH